jgi:hypothetical protein
MALMELQRNKAYILGNLKVGPNKELITKEDAYIEVPFYFKDKGLLIMEDKTSIFGSFALVMGNKYAVWNVPIMYITESEDMTLIEHDDVKYYRFMFKAGATILQSLIAIKTSTIIYSVFNMYLFSGKVPWYIDYDDVANIINKSKKYTGLNVELNSEVIEILVSMAARDPGNLEKQIRNVTKQTRPMFVPIGNVDNLNSNFSKIVGNYQDSGVQSILLSDPDKPIDVEKVIR